MRFDVAERAREADSYSHRVAGEVRAELGRQRISVSQLDVLCGQTRGWAAKRLGANARVSLNVYELGLIADALKVDVRRFIPPLRTVPGGLTDAYLRRRRELTHRHVAVRLAAVA